MDRVSFISTLPPIKGLSPYTLSLLKELSNFVEIDFYGFKSIYPEFLYPGGTKTNESAPKINNVNIFNRLTWYNPFTWIKAGFSIKTKVVHVQWWSWFLAPVFFTTLNIAKIRKKKIIMTIHNVEPHEKSFIKKLMNKSVINLADEYIVHNEDNKTKFQSKMKKKPIHVIPIGIDVKKQINKSTARKELSLSDKDRILLFFGNIRDYKGVDILLQSFDKLKSNPNNQNLKLIIAGQSWDKKIEELIKSSKDVIYSNGFITNEMIPVYFSASDLVVFPYKYFDASSAAATDALSYGKPIVVTKVGGLPSLVRDNKVIAEPSNADSLTSSIEYALKNLNKLESQSKQIAKQFSWSIVAKKTKEVYDGITN